MEPKQTKTWIKTGLIINYFSLLSTVILFEYYRYIDVWSMLSIVALSATLLVFLISFYLVYGKSGAWRQVHLPFSKLDEREAGIMYDSLRIAYSIFAILALTILLVFAFASLPMSMIIFVALLISAHIIPASVMLWKHNRT